MATGIYLRATADTSHGGILKKVWEHNPWILDVKKGSPNSELSRAVINWCNDNLGERTWPYGDSPRFGKWHEGSATIHGWEWLGFDTVEHMNKFIEAWKDRLEIAPPELPTPPEVK